MLIKEMNNGSDSCTRSYKKKSSKEHTAFNINENDEANYTDQPPVQGKFLLIERVDRRNTKTATTSKYDALAARRATFIDREYRK